MIELLHDGVRSEHDTIGDALRAAALITDQLDMADVTTKSWRVSKHEARGVVIVSEARKW